MSVKLAESETMAEAMTHEKTVPYTVLMNFEKTVRDVKEAA